jgi:hypothetical protein
VDFIENFDNESHQEEIETIEKTHNDCGQSVWKFKVGKLTITATYLNEPSEAAISNCNRTYNKHFHDFNKQVGAG